MRTFRAECGVLGWLVVAVLFLKVLGFGNMAFAQVAMAQSPTPTNAEPSVSPDSSTGLPTTTSTPSTPSGSAPSVKSTPAKPSPKPSTSQPASPSALPLESRPGTQNTQAIMTYIQRTSDKTKYVPKLNESLTQDLNTELNHASWLLSVGDYSKAILILNRSISKMKDEQKRHVDAFFPPSFQDYYISDRDKTDFIDQGSMFGVFYSRHYQTKSGRRIDVNIVQDQSAIKEYVDVLKKPSVIANFESTSLIKVAGEYPAIQKYIESDGYCEWNVVLSPRLLVNIVGTNIPSRESIVEFASRVNFLHLQQYLERD